MFNPLPDMPILGFCNSAAKEDVKNMDQWGYNYLTELKTLWEKGEIACYKQFLLFPQCFQNLSVVDASK